MNSYPQMYRWSIIQNLIISCTFELNSELDFSQKFRFAKSNKNKSTVLQLSQYDFQLLGGEFKVSNRHSLHQKLVDIFCFKLGFKWHHCPLDSADSSGKYEHRTNRFETKAFAFLFGWISMNVMTHIVNLSAST